MRSLTISWSFEKGWQQQRRRCTESQSGRIFKKILFENFLFLLLCRRRPKQALQQQQQLYREQLLTESRVALVVVFVVLVVVVAALAVSRFVWLVARLRSNCFCYDGFWNAAICIEFSFKPKMMNWSFQNCEHLPTPKVNQSWNNFDFKTLNFGEINRERFLDGIAEHTSTGHVIKVRLVINHQTGYCTICYQLIYSHFVASKIKISDRKNLPC